MRGVLHYADQIQGKVVGLVLLLDDLVICDEILKMVMSGAAVDRLLLSLTIILRMRHTFVRLEED